MGLIWINNVSINFGGPPLLDGVTLQIEAGERIGLLGRNGSGKSTLMKLLVGDIAPDAGGIVRDGDVKIAMLPQDVSDDLAKINAANNRLETLEKGLDEAYHRWDELESLIAKFCGEPG